MYGTSLIVLEDTDRVECAETYNAKLRLSFVSPNGVARSSVMADRKTMEAIVATILRRLNSSITEDPREQTFLAAVTIRNTGQPLVEAAATPFGTVEETTVSDEDRLTDAIATLNDLAPRLTVEMLTRAGTRSLFINALAFSVGDRVATLKFRSVPQ